jgi:hypothetical protein
MTDIQIYAISVSADKYSAGKRLWIIEKQTNKT